MTKVVNFILCVIHHTHKKRLILVQHSFFLTFFFSFTPYSNDIATIEGCLVVLENEGWDPGIQKRNSNVSCLSNFTYFILWSYKYDWEEL